jgi:hypothetical protein
MAIDVHSEVLLRPAQAARRVPPLRGDGSTHPSTIIRWIVNGCPDGGGGRIFLEAFRTPGGWVTSAEAMARFLAKLTSSFAAGTPPPAAPRPGSASRAGSELKRRGL